MKRNLWADDPANFEALRQNFTTSLLVEGPNMTLEQMSTRLVEMRQELERLRTVVETQSRPVRNYSASDNVFEAIPVSAFGPESR